MITNNRFSKISIALSLSLAAVLLFLRVAILIEEQNVIGKSVAFKGFKIFVVLFSTILPLVIFGFAIIFTIIGSKKKEDSKMVVGSFLLAFLVAIIYYWPFVVILF